MGVIIRIVATMRGFESGFTVERLVCGRVSGFTQQWETREQAEACVSLPAYAWLRLPPACDHGCERFCWDPAHKPLGSCDNCGDATDHPDQILCAKCRRAS